MTFKVICLCILIYYCLFLYSFIKSSYELYSFIKSSYELYSFIKGSYELYSFIKSSYDLYSLIKSSCDLYCFIKSPYVSILKFTSFYPIQNVLYYLFVVGYFSKTFFLISD